MASRIIVELECDLDLPKCTKTEDIETHTMVVDGTAVELEACGSCWGRTMEKGLTAIIEAGRKPKGGRPSRARSAANGTSPADIRAWARDKGFDIPDRGRVPGSVREAYAAAH